MLGSTSRIYAWTDDEDEVAMDAVTVDISTDTRILKIAGLEFGEPKALVFWPEMVRVGRTIQAGSEGPFTDIPAAFAYAHASAKEQGHGQVVVVLQDSALWDERWGKLGSRRVTTNR